MFFERAAAVALAASLAVPSAGLAKSRKQVEQEAQQKAADARHERQLSEAQATHERGAPRPLDDAQREAVGELWSRNQLAGQVASLGLARGQSPEVKNLARWLGDDQRRIAQDLGKLLRERGVDPATLPPSPDLQRLQGDLGALSRASGDAFDRGFVEYLTRNTPTLKEAAGRARDATPGADADLKWYLDQVERLEIGHRDAARQLASQRQARTPSAQQQPRRPAGR